MIIRETFPDEIQEIFLIAHYSHKVNSFHRHMYDTCIREDSISRENRKE